MIFREARAQDIMQIQTVRNSVKENMLSDPSLVSDADCYSFLFERGKGWVAENEDQKITGFAIADLRDKNIWALFVDPAFENQGIGKQLHRLMLDWYFLQTNDTVWLGTAFNTRAEEFYIRQGWEKTGWHGSKEVKFEMIKNAWGKRSADLLSS